MMNYHHTMRDDRFLFLEIKAEQIRKMLLGSLLLAKDAWKDALLGTPEGLRVLKTFDEAADEFIDTSLTYPVEKDGQHHQQARTSRCRCAGFSGSTQEVIIRATSCRLSTPAYVTLLPPPS